mgnify:CR=1 FL=1
MIRQQRVRLTAFIAAKRAQRRTGTSSSVVRVSSEAYAVGHFGPQHGLFPEQAWLADRLLSRATRLRGPRQGFRFALRVAGIVSAVRRGLVGNSRWGRSMLASRGGRTLAREAPQHLRAISTIGVMARQAKAEMRRRYGMRYG